MIIKNTDMHLHTVYSDGTADVTELLKELRSQNIETFSVTDHDTVEFYEKLDYSLLGNLKLIAGIEFSCITPFGKCHILGYGMDIKNKIFQKAITDGQTIRKNKLLSRLGYLEKEYNIIFTDVEKHRLLSLKTAGKPHIAGILVEKGLAENVSDAIKKYMSALPKENDRLPAEVAICAVESAGGVPVWAHPLGGEGERRLSENEFSDRLEYLINCGVRGLECYYSRYNGEDISFLLNKAKEYGLCVSGGSDYHGTVKDIRIGTLSAD